MITRAFVVADKIVGNDDGTYSGVGKMSKIDYKMAGIEINNGGKCNETHFVIFPSTAKIQVNQSHTSSRHTAT